MIPRETLLPFSRPDIGDEEIDEVVACLRSGWITTGPRTQRLEREFAERVGVKHAIAVTSGTAALHIVMLAMEIGPGDEVIVPSLTWPSTANMVVACGGTPVFAEIDRRTLNIDPAAIANAITPRTKAIIPVHYAGLPADLDRILDVLRAANRTDIRIIEDAAHAAGSFYKGRPIGGTGANGTAAACFSLHPIKNITTAEGGIVTTDDDALAETMKLWKFHGVQRDAWKAYSGTSKGTNTYDVVLPGFKYNLTDIQSALGIHQLAKLDRFNARRHEIAMRYREAFSDMPNLEIQLDPDYDHVHPWHLFTVRPPERAAFVEGLRELGIGSGLHFEAVHLHQLYREKYGWSAGRLPVTEDVCSRIVSLPLFPLMTDTDVEDVIASVKRLLG